MDEMRYKGKVDKELFLHVRSELMNKWQKRIAVTAICICLALGVALFIKGYYPPATVLAVGMFLFVLESLWISGNAVKKVMRRMIPLVGDGEYSIILEKSAFRVRGPRMKSFVRVKYAEVVELWEKPMAFFLYTYEMQLFTIDKTELTDDEINRLRIFLAGHCSNAIGEERVKSRRG